MKKLDPAFYWILFYLLSYMIALKLIPTTAGAFSLAVMFALIIENISNLIQKLRVRRWIAVLLASLIFFGIISYSMYRVIPILIEQWGNVSAFVSEFMNKKPSDIFPYLKGDETVQIFKSAMDNIGQLFVSYLGKTLTFVVSKIPDIFTATLLLVISSAYLVIVLPMLRNAIPHMFPKSTLDRTYRFIASLYSDMKKFVGGQMFNATVVGFIVWCGMMLSGIKYAGFLGILSGITDFIPFLGVIITGVPAIFIGISQYGLLGILKVLIVLTIANQVEGWILAPRVLGERVKLNWFVVLITMLALSEIYGVIGILIAVPFLVMTKDIWREYITDYLKRT